MQIVHTVNWCTWLAHTLCKGLIWNYKDCWAVEHSLDFHLGSCKRRIEHVSGNLFLLIWYTLMKNKHQISLYLGLKKMANTLQITFSNGFSFKKKLLSVCLSVCLSVPFTPFSLCSHLEIFRSDYQWQKWCLCKSSRSEVKSQGYRGQNPN